MWFCPVPSLSWQSTSPNLPLKLVIKRLWGQMCHLVCLYRLHWSMWWLPVTSLVLASLDGAYALAHWVRAGLTLAFPPVPLWGWTGLVFSYKPSNLTLCFTERWKSWVFFSFSFRSVRRESQRKPVLSLQVFSYNDQLLSVCFPL